MTGSANHQNSGLAKPSPIPRNVFIFLLLATALGLLMSEFGARMHWPYMVIAYIMASGVYYYEKMGFQKKTGKGRLMEYLFSRDIWLHKSAIQDYAIVVINYVIIVALFQSIVFSPYGSYVITHKIIAMLPLSESHAAPGFFVITLCTFCTFALADLFYYISHRMTHEIPILWEFHKVHHSAKVLTPVTLHRAHPFDVWFNASCRMIGVGIASGIFFYFYPTIDGITTIMGVDAFVLISYVIGANLRHSHIWLSFGPAVEHFLMSPAQHQIHHSEKPEHFDKNFGSALTIWDWAFGSLYITHGKEDITYGLGSAEEEAELDGVWKLYARPIQNAWAMVLGTNKKQKTLQKDTAAK